MDADRRLYLIIYRHNSDSADSEIWTNTDRLIGKSRKKYPNTIIDVTKYPTDGYFINTSWYFQNNDLGNLYKTEIQTKLQALTNRSELIIRGHGDVGGCKVSGIGPEVLARGLLSYGFNVHCRINITGCNLGRNAAANGAGRAVASVNTVGVDSFAFRFLTTLNKEGHLFNEVHARTSTVTVAANGQKETWPFDDPDGDPIHQQPHSKIIYRMSKKGVAMRFAY